ncbi:MAG: rod shape-determining protein MreD [Acidimicrobiales bacterium]
MIVALRWSLVLVAAVLLQATLVSQLPILSERGDVVLLFVIAAGIVGGAEVGALVGFAFGLSFDLLLQTPFGLSALAYCLAGYGVGALQTGVLRTAWWIPVVSAVAGSALGVLAFAVVGAMIGQDGLVTDRLPAIIGAVTIVNAVLVVPAVRLARWAQAAGRQARLAAR